MILTNKGLALEGLQRNFDAQRCFEKVKEIKKMHEWDLYNTAFNLCVLGESEEINRLKSAMPTMMG